MRALLNQNVMKFVASNLRREGEKNGMKKLTCFLCDKNAWPVDPPSLHTVGDPQALLVMKPLPTALCPHSTAPCPQPTAH